jgi:hypothetical protein
MEATYEREQAALRAWHSGLFGKSIAKCDDVEAFFSFSLFRYIQFFCSRAYNTRKKVERAKTRRRRKVENAIMKQPTNSLM